MYPTPTRLDPEAFTRLCKPVDKARAIFRGLSLVGHRRSVETAEMCWALPGRNWTYGSDLARDPTFEVVQAPTKETLTQLQAAYLGLCVGVARV